MSFLGDTLELHEVLVYGRAVWRPSNELARRFADLLAQKSFNERDVQKLKALGYKVLLRGEHIPDTVL